MGGHTLPDILVPFPFDVEQTQDGLRIFILHSASASACP
jgi:hypothetical protein